MELVSLQGVSSEWGKQAQNLDDTASSRDFPGCTRTRPGSKLWQHLHTGRGLDSSDLHTGPSPVSHTACWAVKGLWEVKGPWWREGMVCHPLEVVSLLEVKSLKVILEKTPEYTASSKDFHGCRQSHLGSKLLQHLRTGKDPDSSGLHTDPSLLCRTASAAHVLWEPLRARLQARSSSCNISQTFFFQVRKERLCPESFAQICDKRSQRTFVQNVGCWDQLFDHRKQAAKVLT